MVTSEACSWLVPLLYVVLHFWTSSPLVIEQGQAAPGTYSGGVTQPTWPCDMADWPHDCEITSGTWQL